MVSICINIPLKTSSLNWSLRHKSRLCQWQIQRSKLQIYTETSREVLSLRFTQNDSEIRNSMNFWGRNQPFIHTPLGLLPKIRIMFQLSTINYPMVWSICLDKDPDFANRPRPILWSHLFCCPSCCSKILLFLLLDTTEILEFFGREVVELTDMCRVDICKSPIQCCCASYVTNAK